MSVVEYCKEELATNKPFMILSPISNGEGELIPGEKMVATREESLSDRIGQRSKEALPFTGDKGILLSDVYAKNETIDAFLQQLSNEELIYLTRGEGMCSPKVTAGTAAAFGGVAKSHKKYGIPIGCCADGPSGIRMDCGTMAFSLPNGTLLACTFNTTLVESLYELEGQELRLNKIDTLLGPGINIHRNPLNGRNFEYFSEDPYLTGTMAVAQLKGMHKYGVTGTIKHFACNNQEYNRHTVDAIVSERAIREIYLKAFEMAVKKGDAYCIMSTYGPINGIWTAGNYELLTSILREEWNYKGLVMTDWWAKINEEGKEATIRNTSFMIRAQNDVYMVTVDAEANTNEDDSERGLLEGIINREDLVRCVKNICEVLMRTPAIERRLGIQDNIKQINLLQEEQEPYTSEQNVTITKSSYIPCNTIKTSKGNRNVLVLHFEERGNYKITFSLSAQASELAQMPMAVFINNKLVQTISIKGGEDSVVTRSMPMEVFTAVDFYVELYFAQSGIHIHEIKIEKESELSFFS